MRPKKKGYVYILSNKTRTVLYTGVSSDAKDRVRRHRNAEGSEFTLRHHLKYLMQVEEQATMLKAIEREKQIKGWKLELIRTVNPTLRELWYEL